MDVRRLADGLWRWTAPHPNAADWPDFGTPVPPEVGCVYYEAPDALVLFDPLLPAGEEEEFLVYLDRDLARLGLPVSILLTAAWHRRSSAILRERYRADDRIPDSVEVFPIEGAPEEQLHELGDVLAWLASLAEQLGLSLDEAAARYAQGCPRCGSIPCACA